MYHTVEMLLDEIEKKYGVPKKDHDGLFWAWPQIWPNGHCGTDELIDAITTQAFKETQTVVVINENFVAVSHNDRLAYILDITDGAIEFAVMNAIKDSNLPPQSEISQFLESSREEFDRFSEILSSKRPVDEIMEMLLGEDSDGV